MSRDKTISMYGGECIMHFNEDAHTYWFEGRKDKPPGVTSVLKILDKPALIQWAANMASDYVLTNYELGTIPFDSENLADARLMSLDTMTKICKDAKTAHRRMSKDAAGVGTIVHQFAEDVLKTGKASLPTDPLAQKGAAAFLDWFHNTNAKVIDSERMVFSKHWYYAGTCDFYGHIDGKRCVMDIKTSSGLYAEMSLQLAAYAIAIEEETGEKIEDGWIVRLDKKTGKCEPFHIPLTTALKQAFCRVYEVYEAMKKVVEPLTEEAKSNGLSAKRAA